jgi:hypothetical protein
VTESILIRNKGPGNKLPTRPHPRCIQHWHHHTVAGLQRLFPCRGMGSSIGQFRSHPCCRRSSCASGTAPYCPSYLRVYDQGPRDPGWSRSSQLIQPSGPGSRSSRESGQHGGRIQDAVCFICSTCSNNGGSDSLAAASPTHKQLTQYLKPLSTANPSVLTAMLPIPALASPGQLVMHARVLLTSPSLSRRARKVCQACLVLKHGVSMMFCSRSIATFNSALPQVT